MYRFGSPFKHAGDGHRQNADSSDAADGTDMTMVQ